MDGLPAPVEGADIPVRQEETPQATAEKEATIAPPENRGLEGPEKPPPKDKSEDLSGEAEKIGVETARGLTAPESPEVQTDPQVVKSQEEVSGRVVSPITFQAVAWAQRREAERRELSKKAA